MFSSTWATMEPAGTQLSGKGSVPWNDRGEACEGKTENEICNETGRDVSVISFFILVNILVISFTSHIPGDVSVAGLVQLAQNRREWPSMVAHVEEDMALR